MHLIKTMAATAIVASLPALSLAAADLSGPREVYETYQPQSAPHRNFYVRGDVGVGRHGFNGFSQDELTANGGSFISGAISDTVTIGAGIGWQVSNRFRFDVTGEYRSTARVKGMDNLTASLVDPGGVLQSNTIYDGNLSSFVGLLNGYWDLGNWRGFTPYVGAGVGFAHHRMNGFTTLNSASFIDAVSGDRTLELSSGIAQSHSQTNLAWALMAGTSYDLSPNSKMDLGYRYISLGSGVAAATSIINCICGTVGSAFKVNDLEAHEFRIGMRWMLGSEPRYVEPHRPMK